MKQKNEKKFFLSQIIECELVALIYLYKKRIVTATGLEPRTT